MFRCRKAREKKMFWVDLVVTFNYLNSKLVGPRCTLKFMKSEQNGKKLDRTEAMNIFVEKTELSHITFVRKCLNYVIYGYPHLYKKS